MATTLGRPTVTDDTGTPAAPNEDGTLLDSTLFTAIFDAIDAMWSGATQVFAGVFSADGLGTHGFSAGGAGHNTVQVRNTSDGTTRAGTVEVGNSADADLGRLEAYAPSYTESGAIKQNGVALRGMGVGGVSISAEHASGEVRLYGKGATSPVAQVNGDHIYGGGACVLYPVTIATASNTTSEITVLTTTIAHAFGAGDLIITDMPFMGLNNTGAGRNLNIDVLYGGVEGTLMNQTIIADATESYDNMQIIWMRNGVNVVVAANCGVWSEQGSSSQVIWGEQRGVTLASPTLTAGQTLSIKVTLGVASASYYVQPVAGACRHMFLNP